jgi:hypothetical protein
MLSCQHDFVQPLLTYAAEASASWQQRCSITNFFMSKILTTQCICILQLSCLLSAQLET